jgi:hypothetical protein
MPEQKAETHGMLVGGFSPYTKAHHENVNQMLGGSHASVNVFATQSSRRPISAEKKVDYIKTAAGEGVNVNTTLTPFHAAAQLHAEGKRGKLVLYGGSDRAPIADRLREYNGKEGKHGYYNFEGGIEFRQVGGERKEGAKGLAGISGTAARKAKNPQELKKFIPKELHPRAEEIFNDMNESTNPIGIFLLGGPGSGKDYVLKNIFSRFDLTEVQADHVLNGTAGERIAEGKNIVINGALDQEKIQIISSILENYNLDTVYVSVTNKVSRLRNSLRENPLSENKRLEKWYRSEKMIESLEDKFVFNNSINLNESSEMERVFFANQIEKLLERLIEHGLVMREEPAPQNITLIREKKFPAVRKKYGMPEKYSTGLSKSTALARKRHWAKANKLSDSDPEAYKPAPGDATAKTKPSKHTLAVRKMMGEEIVTEGKADKSIAAKAKKSGISLRTLKAVYRRGVAAWNSGHRPGTTPSQWGHARVNSYINKGKTYHTADKDLREEADIDELFEMQLVGTDEYRRHAISMTPGQNQEIEDVTQTMGLDSAEGDCDCVYESDCECDDEMSAGNRKSFREFRAEAKETQVELLPTADVTPTLSKSKPDNSKKTPAKPLRAAVDGMAITSRLTGEEVEQVDEGIKDTVTKAFTKLRRAYRDVTSPVKGVESPEKITRTPYVRPELKDVNASSETQSNINPRIARRRSEVDAARQVADDAANARSFEQIRNDMKDVKLTPKPPPKPVGQRVAAVIPDSVKRAGKATAGVGKAVVDVGSAVGRVPGVKPALKVGGILGTVNLAQMPLDYAGNRSPEEILAARKAERERRARYKETTGQDFETAAARAAGMTGGVYVDPLAVSKFMYDTKPGEYIRSAASAVANVPVPDPLSIPVSAVFPGASAGAAIKQFGRDVEFWKNYINDPTDFRKKAAAHRANEDYSPIDEKVSLEEAVAYHLSEGISFTENAFRPGSEMFFEMINVAKDLYKEGAYKPADEWEKDMLNSNIGERAIFEGREVILDYPFQEELDEEVMQLDEVFDVAYPHQYHGTIGTHETADHAYSFHVPEKGAKEFHTYSVFISNEPKMKKGNVSFQYQGKQSKGFSPIKGDDVDYLMMPVGGETEITGKGGGKTSAIISTVKNIVQKHAKKHGLGNVEFGGNMYEPSRTKLYDRIAKRFGGKELGQEDEDSPYIKYSVPVKEGSDPTDGKGIGKPWRENGGGAVYVRDGDSIRKIRFSQSGMKKKYMNPGATRSFVARHRCLTNKDKTSASYWACRWPRFFSNSGKVWW